MRTPVKRETTSLLHVFSESNAGNTRKRAGGGGRCSGKTSFCLDVWIGKAPWKRYKKGGFSCSTRRHGDDAPCETSSSIQDQACEKKNSHSPRHAESCCLSWLDHLGRHDLATRMQGTPSSQGSHTFRFASSASGRLAKLCTHRVNTHQSEPEPPQRGFDRAFLRIRIFVFSYDTLKKNETTGGSFRHALTGKPKQQAMKHDRNTICFQTRLGRSASHITPHYM